MKRLMTMSDVCDEFEAWLAREHLRDGTLTEAEFRRRMRDKGVQPSDPNVFRGGKWKWRPNFDGKGRIRDDAFIADLKDPRAEKEGLYPYVKGKGPRPFTSNSQKRSYMKRYGFEEDSFEDFFKRNY